MFATVHLEDQTVLLSEVVVEVVQDHQGQLQDHQGHQGHNLEEVAVEVEVAAGVESPEEVAGVLETQEQLTVIPIILLGLSNVMEMGEPFPNNVMELHTIRILVIVNKITFH